MVFYVFLKKHWNARSKGISACVCLLLAGPEVWVNWHIDFNAQHLVLLQRWTLSYPQRRPELCVAPYPDEIWCLQYTIAMSAIRHQLSSGALTHLPKPNMNSPIWYRLVFHHSSDRLGVGIYLFLALHKNANCTLRWQLEIWTWVQNWELGLEGKSMSVYLFL